MRQRVLAVILCSLAWPGVVGAQGVATTLPTFGTRQIHPAVDPDAVHIPWSNVGFLEGAAPAGQVRIRFDGSFHNQGFYRAEVDQAKPGLLGGPGLPNIERRISSQELSTYVEYQVIPWFAPFMEMPFRWLNPDVNNNLHGFGQTRLGFRAVTWNGEKLLASFFLRLETGAGQKVGLTNEHWSVEPGLLTTLKILDNLQLHGELRYWVPIGGTDLAGDVLQYGLGLAWGQKTNAVWWMPIVEAKGWTPMGGRILVPDQGFNFTLEDAKKQTVINGYLGVRVGWGPNVDMFFGYGRALTGNQFYRDQFRLDMRWMY